MKTPVRSRVLAKAISMAVLADAQTPEHRTPQALVARVQASLGLEPAAGSPLPAFLLEQLQRLSAMSSPEWARWEPEDVAAWLCWGRWWRSAGLRWGTEHSGAGVEDGASAWDGDDEDIAEPDGDGEGDDILPGLPPTDWTAPRLGQAFRIWTATARSAVPRRWLLRPAGAGPLPAWMDRGTTVPVLATATDVAQVLAVSVEDLLWLAPQGAFWRERHSEGHSLPASHYRYRLLPKPSGGLRLLESPRPRLVHAQRRILYTLLANIPTHEAAHGFVRGRSVGSHARIHTGQAVVIRFDLADFFTQIHATRVRALWRALGHGRAAAELLTQLTTARTPAGVRDRLLESMPELPTSIAQRRATAQRLARPHLPQGAPTSPALANLCAFGLDVRLQALAQRFGANYTRYADDLVFSGPDMLRRQFIALRAWVAAIAQDEGFALRADKTRVMPAHQRQFVTGLVVNQRANYSRVQFDTLKARLHRLAQQAQVDAGERARLEGEIRWASQWLAPARTAKLQRLLAAIRFGSMDSGLAAKG
ncbi:Reverse transcriptase (RNA-dependent DNA polymerase) [Acidovorax sp. CF316]|uniref:reverse transcriptase family protein n=1 Tax=Acidovorax sp. CF316 TaxID=1144317 RepID=UPI00026BDA80|nr:reverse transcriptase family protein [Acidovorax sp. CF316]EJE55016.1 Reverse transcriptase (RNA-dependent DNA polymerase) [Acidovorax sp. CF316]